VTVIRQTEFGQGKRIARIVYILAKEGGKSRPELKARFNKISESSFDRDISLLKSTGVIVVQRKPETTVTKISGKTVTRVSRIVYIFFKDNTDIVGRTRKAMRTLAVDFSRITIDQIASTAGLPPRQIEEHAYRYAPTLNIQIGKEPLERPPNGLFVGKGTSAEKATP
jgi:hypothetical protein